MITISIIDSFINPKRATSQLTLCNCHFSAAKQPNEHRLNFKHNGHFTTLKILLLITIVSLTQIQFDADVIQFMSLNRHVSPSQIDQPPKRQFIHSLMKFCFQFLFWCFSSIFNVRYSSFNNFPSILISVKRKTLMYKDKLVLRFV